MSLNSKIPVNFVAQSKGLFLYLDPAESGFINLDQFNQALQMLGVSSNENMKKQLYTNSNEGEDSEILFMNFEKFTHLLYELFLARKHIELDLKDLLLSFDECNDKSKSKSFVSEETLRHLLVDVDSPYRLKAEEFERFKTSMEFKDEISIDFLIQSIIFNNS